MLFFLLAGHALMDFALQGEAMATCKCRHANHPLQQSVPWYYWMTAHALLHGAAVGLVVRWFGYDMKLAVAFAIAERTHVPSEAGAAPRRIDCTARGRERR